MIGLDTNAICRYLLGDDPAQTRAAAKVIENAASSGEGCFLSKIVLCELVCVLESCTSIDRAGIVRLLEGLLHAHDMEIEDRQAVHRALALCRTGKGDFADYLIHESDALAGCEKTVTFDRDLRGAPGFEVL